MEKKTKEAISNQDLVQAWLAVLIILALWRLAYPITCLAIAFPFLICLPIVRGLYEINLKRRHHCASFYLKKDSCFYALLTGKLLVSLRSLVIGVLMTLSTSAFAGLASLSDMMFILFSSGLTLFLSFKLRHVMRRHIADHVQSIAYRWMVFKWSGALMIVLYTLISYYYVPVPDYLDPSSLNNTISVASQQVGSVCKVTNLYLKFVQEVDSIGWYMMLSSSDKVQNEMAHQGIWLLFLLYHGVVFFGLACLQIEAAYAINKIRKEAHL